MDAKILDIVTNPNPVLRKIAQLVDINDLKTEKYQQLIADMVLTMYKKDGVGLAAPQINQSLKIVVISTKDGAMPLINPVVTNKSFKKETDEEGCLSVPKTYGKVKRPYKITVKAYDQTGQPVEFEVMGFLARIIQHEIDHINGILFIDKAKHIRHEN